MSFRVRLCLSLLALVLASATLALGAQDPELRQCKQKCRAQQQFGREKRELCEQRCEDYYREKHGGGGGYDEEEEVSWNRESPIERLRECSRRCQQQHGEQTQQCQQRCQEQYEREKEQYEGSRGGGRGDDNPRDPQREYQQCRERCRRQAQHGGSTQECEQRCEKRQQEHERRQGGGGRGSDDNPTDPQREFQECRERCRRQGQHGGSTQECEQRCEQRRQEREQQQQEQERGGRGSEDNPTDPQREFQECRERCRRQAQHGGSTQQCEQRCEERRRERERRQGGGGGQSDSDDNPSDPEREYQQCRETCRRQAKQGSTQECLQRCEQKRRERQQGRDSYDRSEEETYEGREGEEIEQEFQGQNPYVFEDRHFRTGMQTQHGRVRILQKFTDRSKLHKGIENYRLTILEMEPQTFTCLITGTLKPCSSLQTVFDLVLGRGTLNMVRRNRRESFNIREGDVVRIRAGTTAYLVNKDNNQKLVLAKLLQPVSTPGEFEIFFGAGGQNPETFYRAFSDEILEAAFDVKRDRLQRLFGQQSQGAIVKASQEQIRAMGRHEEGGIWPFGGETKGSINLFQQHPTQQNQYGQLYEVDSSHYRQLRDLDVSVSLANITQGAMTAPHYNSKATKIAVVVEGEGYFEMACPHVSQSTQGSRGGSSRWRKEQETQDNPSYQKISSRLRRGTVVVVPAGHPFVAVASKNQNLQLLCFEVNAYDNEKYTLAGRRNVINQIEREAKELAFGVPAREVEEVFRSQEEEFFFRGPRQQQQGRAEE